MWHTGGSTAATVFLVFLPAMCHASLLIFHVSVLMFSASVCISHLKLSSRFLHFVPLSAHADSQP